MGSKKKNKKQTVKEQPPFNSSVPARNLPKSELGAVIFGCKGHTLQECLSGLIFGLPAGHFAYVKKVSPGLPLFLFNYSDRKLLGTFEAACPGQLNIDPYAWTNGSGYETEYPAQVKIKVFNRCYALTEDQFSPIIADNYYETRLFSFELDHSQTAKLIKLFSSSAVLYAGPFPHNKTTSEASSYIPQGSYHASVPYDGVQQHNASTSGSSITLPQSNAYDQREQKTWSSLFKYDTTSDTANKYEILKAESSRPTSPLSEKYNAEWESCTSPSINKSELREVWDEDIEGDADNIQPFLEAPVHKVSAEEFEGDADNIQQFHEALACSLNGSSSSEHEVCAEEEVEGNSDNHEPFVEAPVYSADVKSSKDQLIIPPESSDILSMLMQEVALLKARQMKQEEKNWTLEKELVQLRDELQKLQIQHHVLEGFYREPLNCSANRDNYMLVVGGFDGSNWLPSICSYSPLHDHMESLATMRFPRSFFSVADLNSEVYVFGGKCGEVWCDTVETYNLRTKEWCKRPPLNRKKAYLGGASLHDKIFAVGGGNGFEFFSEVEMLDLNIGKWMHCTSMLEKRVGTAAAQIKGALYAVGGCDGKDYLKSAERFDPREKKWRKLSDMETKRQCHSLVAYNERLYALGGYDGSRIISSVEAFDLRMGSWTMVDEMKDPRTNFGAVVIGGKIYALGGLINPRELLDTVECYEDGCGWKRTGLRGVGKRCFFSSLVL